MHAARRPLGRPSFQPPMSSASAGSCPPRLRHLAVISALLVRRLVGDAFLACPRDARSLRRGAVRFRCGDRTESRAGDQHGQDVRGHGVGLTLRRPSPAGCLTPGSIYAAGGSVVQGRAWTTGPIRRCCADGVGDGWQHPVRFWCGRLLADPISADRPGLCFADDGHLWSMARRTMIGKLTLCRPRMPGAAWPHRPPVAETTICRHRVCRIRNSSPAVSSPIPHLGLDVHDPEGARRNRPKLGDASARGRPAAQRAPDGRGQGLSETAGVKRLSETAGVKRLSAMAGVERLAWRRCARCIAGMASKR